MQLVTHSPAALIGQFRQSESSADQLIASLAAASDVEVIEIRNTARLIGRTAWRVECAADAEILKRENQRKGRGVRDSEGVGVIASVKKAAAAIGVSQSVIFQNAKIHQTFFNTPSAWSINIEDKEFYSAAVAADDPHAALKTFAEKKAADPDFSTRDAWRIVREAKAPPLDEKLSPLIEDEAVKNWYHDFLKVMQHAPPMVRRVVRDTVDEVRDCVQAPVQSRRQQLFQLIAEGIDELDWIAKNIGVNRTYVAVWLNRLEEEGQLERFEKPRALEKQGQPSTGYRRVV